MKDFMSQNGGILAVLAVCFALGAGYLEWRIAIAVSDQFAANAQVEPHRMEAAEKDINELKQSDEKLDGKIERIVGILLED